MKGQGTVEVSEIHGGAERLKSSGGVICSEGQGGAGGSKISKLKGREFSGLNRTSG